SPRGVTGANSQSTSSSNSSSSITSSLTSGLPLARPPLLLVRRCGDDSGVVAALDGDGGEGGCHGVEVVTRWRWVDVEPAAVGQRRWCWLCSGGAGGGEAAKWSRWRVGESGVGDRTSFRHDIESCHRTTERQCSVNIDSNLISFWIRLVNMICEHLVTLLYLELKVNDIWVECFKNFIILPFE
nr:hypothetical protein [Tanacetum cinerariifolium]